MYTHNQERAEQLAQSNTQDFVSGIEESKRLFALHDDLKPESFDKNLLLYNLVPIKEAKDLSVAEKVSAEAYIIGLSVGFETRYLRDRTESNL